MKPKKLHEDLLVMEPEEMVNLVIISFIYGVDFE